MAIHDLRSHIPKYEARSPLLSVCIMVFFFVIFDGVLMYLAPIVITGAGISESIMGLIIGSSSIAGMLFDFFLCRAIKETYYRRMFLFMLILAASYPLFLFGGTTITIYLIAMAIWGFYYDFYNMGTIDFVERTADPDQHISNFGVLRAFEGLGYLIAPFAGSILLLLFHPGPQMLAVLAAPLLISFLFYIIIVLRPVPERDGYNGVAQKDILTFLTEMHLWKKIGVVLLPILALTMIINLVDSAIWTFGPIFSESVGAANGFSGGLFMTAYALPPLLVGWIVGAIARKHGMKRTAQAAIAVGSILLMCLGVVTEPILLIGIVFLAAFSLSIGWPSVNAIYTDYIKNNPEYRKEIETLQDLFTNVGDTSGPIVGGYMAQYLGFSHAFVALGGVGLITALSLFAITSRGR